MHWSHQTVLWILHMGTVGQEDGLSHVPKSTIFSWQQTESLILKHSPQADMGSYDSIIE